jgi:hypothetical protein
MSTTFSSVVDRCRFCADKTCSSVCNGSQLCAGTTPTVLDILLNFVFFSRNYYCVLHCSDCCTDAATSYVTANSDDYTSTITCTNSTTNYHFVILLYLWQIFKFRQCNVAFSYATTWRRLF